MLRLLSIPLVRHYHVSVLPPDIYKLEVMGTGGGSCRSAVRDGDDLNLGPGPLAPLEKVRGWGEAWTEIEVNRGIFIPLGHERPTNNSLADR